GGNGANNVHEWIQQCVLTSGSSRSAKERRRPQSFTCPTTTKASFRKRDSNANVEREVGIAAAHRRELRVSGGDQKDPCGGPVRCERADLGGNRDREGDVCSGDPLSQSTSA